MTLRDFTRQLIEMEKTGNVKRFTAAIIKRGKDFYLKQGGKLLKLDPNLTPADRKARLATAKKHVAKSNRLLKTLKRVRRGGSLPKVSGISMKSGPRREREKKMLRTAITEGKARRSPRKNKTGLGSLMGPSTLRMALLGTGLAGAGAGTTYALTRKKKELKKTAGIKLFSPLVKAKGKGWDVLRKLQEMGKSFQTRPAALGSRGPKAVRIGSKGRKLGKAGKKGGGGIFQPIGSLISRFL